MSVRPDWYNKVCVRMYVRKKLKFLCKVCHALSYMIVECDTGHPLPQKVEKVVK